MINDPAVVYSFCLYLLYVLLPLIPAILIFRLFPETKVAVSGPLQNLTVKTTGAFAAYVVTALLGFFLVRQVEAQIVSSRHYPVEGVIVDLPTNQGVRGVASDQIYWRNDPDRGGSNRDFPFVVLLNHPLGPDETIFLKYWEYGDEPAGTGPPPTENTTVPLKLLKTNSPQLFKLVLQNNRPAFEPVSPAAK
jgi:hypothetical protein